MKSKPSAAAASIVDRMVEAALGSAPIEATFVEFLTALRNEGVRVDRAYLAHPTLHPLHSGSALKWSVEAGLARENFVADDRDEENSADWLQSPIRHVIVTGAERLRRRLAGPGEMLDFPVLESLRRDGLTDYLLLATRFESFGSRVEEMAASEEGRESGMIVSFATRRPGGFSDEEVETLEWLKRPLAILVKVADQRAVAHALAECYIGRAAGPRVLGGAIRRGDFATTEAVVWLSDLRGSTELALSLPREGFVAAINDFFEATAGAVEAEGGETLTFIGDGALAIFPVEAMGVEGARRAALRAAGRAAEAIRTLNAGREGLPPLRWGLALHAGALDYGNIGTTSRHAWSVVGPVVNETARLEGVTKLSGEPVVASRAFVSALPEAARWRALGAFPLAGVPQPFEAFAPPHAGALKEKAA